MADGVTPNLGLIKPEFDASTDTWGPKLNGNLDVIDQAIQALRLRGSYQAAEFGTYLSTQQDTDAGANAWTQYPINTVMYDPQSLIAPGSNYFIPSANVAIEWDVMFTVVQDDISAWYEAHQQVYADFRLFNVSDAVVASRGFRGSHSHTYSQTKYPSGNSGMKGSSMVHCRGGARLVAGKTYKYDYYHRRPGTSTRWFLKYVENTAGQSDELVMRTKVWKLDI